MRLLLLGGLLTMGVAASDCRVVQAQAAGGPARAVAPWLPPKTTLPKAWVDATQFVITNGIADPRGGDYGEATIQVGRIWDGDGGKQSVHGWRMADGEFLAWNGLYYRPIRVGRSADLERDLRASKTSNRLLGIGYEGDGEAANLQVGAAPISVSLLLLLGKPALAEMLVARLRADSAFVPLNALIRTYAANRFDRAVAAHMRGDDLLAAEDAQALSEMRPMLENALVKQRGRVDIAKLSFLDPCDVLTQDSLRRIREGKKAWPSDRIAGLIQDLDQVSARQSSQPGGVSLGMDPIVAALVKEGDGAIEPLLDCIEHDTRLTRAVGFGRDFFPDRKLLAVKDAAYAAFCGIADANEFGANGARPTVAELRAWWRQNRGKTNPERWMATLEDDNAGERKWTEAAERLTESTSITHLGRWTTVGVAEGPMKGEPVRSRTHPSVSELLAKRALELLGAGEVNDTSMLSAAASGAKIARDLAHWEGAAALPTLKSADRRLLELTQSGTLKEFGTQILGQELAQLVCLCVSFGDDDVVPGYISWLRTVAPHGMFGFELTVMGPFWRYPDDPKLRAGAKELFSGKGSAWNVSEVARDQSNWWYIESLIATPILRVPAFRAAVLDLLDDRAPIGTVWATKQGGISYEVPNGAKGVMSMRPLSRPDRLAKIDERRPYRLCDAVATQLDTVVGTPDYRPYWPERLKDATISKMKSLLADDGEKLAASVKVPFGTQVP